MSVMTTDLWRMSAMELAELDGRFQDKGSPRGMTIQVCRPAVCVDERLNILYFTRDCIGFGIPAVTSASPIVVIHCEMRRKQVREVRTRPT